jgi:hypothetical protein
LVAAYIANPLRSHIHLFLELLKGGAVGVFKVQGGNMLNQPLRTGATVNAEAIESSPE